MPHGWAGVHVQRRTPGGHNSDMEDDLGDIAGDQWVVWRQDDNGNRFEVARFDSRPEADAVAADFQARGHRQTYWVARAVAGSERGI
jgi:hypothetical protein